jgi:hypothetical protein
MQNEIHPSPHLAQSCTYFSPSRNLEHLILSDERSRSNCHLRYIRAKLLVPGLIYLPASASLAYLAHLFRINYACQTSSSATMAAATACASTALAGQSLLKPVNELSRKVGNVEARVTMRRTVSKSAGSDSIW